MMNPGPQNIQKREIVVVHIAKNKYKSPSNLGPFNLIEKCLGRNMAVIVEQS